MWGPLNTQRNKLDVRVGERRRVKCAVEQEDFAAAFDVYSEIRRWKRTRAFAAEQRQAAAGAHRDSQKLPGLKQVETLLQPIFGIISSFCCSGFRWRAVGRGSQRQVGDLVSDSLQETG